MPKNCRPGIASRPSIKSREQRAFVAGASTRYAASRRFATVFRGWIATAAEFGEVIDSGADSGDQFLNLRAGFPAIGDARP